jgi:hypothetical protein
MHVMIVFGRTLKIAFRVLNLVRARYSGPCIKLLPAAPSRLTPRQKGKSESPARTARLRMLQRRQLSRGQHTQPGERTLVARMSSNLLLLFPCRFRFLRIEKRIRNAEGVCLCVFPFRFVSFSAAWTHCVSNTKETQNI